MGGLSMNHCLHWAKEIKMGFVRISVSAFKFYSLFHFYLSYDTSFNENIFLRQLQYI